MYRIGFLGNTTAALEANLGAPWHVFWQPSRSRDVPVPCNESIHTYLNETKL
jgi:hypothetical protein